MENVFISTLADNGVIALIVGYFVYGFNKNFSRLIDWLMTWTVDVKVNTVVAVKQKEDKKERTD